MIIPYTAHTGTLTTKLINSDCLEALSHIPTATIDAVICDPPYGTTKCKWDTVIPFEPMWEQLLRVTKEDGAILLFGAEPFSSLLRASNLPMFKYDWIWQKSKAQHFAQAPYRPMTNHEIISVFSRGGTAKNAKPRMVYYPQGLEDCDRVCRGKKGDHSAHRAKRSDQADYRQTKTGYPKTIQAFDNARKTVHPTQKPLDLMEFLVRSYTSEGDVVLDFAMGSGTTGLACQLATRCFIGIEKDSHYFSIAKKLLEHVPYT